MFTGDRIELFPITFGRGFKLVLRKSNKSAIFDYIALFWLMQTRQSTSTNTLLCPDKLTRNFYSATSRSRYNLRSCSKAGKCSVAASMWKIRNSI